MATYSLSGSGEQTLTAGVAALHVTISTLPAGAGHGLATPTDYWGVGQLRPGNATAFWEPYVVCGGPQWMPVPSGSTRIGYSFATGAVVSVAEVFGSSPLAFPLGSLPDVGITSPTDTQVLTYQASSSKWINAAAPSGGGGASGATTILLNYTATTDLHVATAFAANTFVNVGPSQSFAVTSATAIIEVWASGSILTGAAPSFASLAGSLLIDGTTRYRISGLQVGTTAMPYFNMLSGSGPVLITGLSAASHTVQLQLRCEQAGTLYLRAATNNESYQLRVTQIT